MKEKTSLSTHKQILNYIENYRLYRIVPDVTLEEALEQLKKYTGQMVLFGNVLNSIAVFAGKILYDYQTFATRHLGINWKALSQLDRVRADIESMVYVNVPSLIIHSLSTPEIRDEFENLSQVFQRIQKFPLYRQTQTVMPFLTVLTEFDYDGRNLYTMSQEFEEAGLSRLNTIGIIHLDQLLLQNLRVRLGELLMNQSTPYLAEMF